MSQLHKRFTDSEAKRLLEIYTASQIKRAYLEKILGIERRRLCQLIKKYKKDSQGFSIEYNRKKPIRKIVT